MDPRLRTFALASLVVANVGCGKSCKNDHPYVPYAVGDGATASASASVAVSPDAGPQGDGKAEAAAAMAAGTTRIDLDGMTLAAPDGKELVLALVRDFDGDGKKEALAIVRTPAPKDKPNEAGSAEIVFFDANGKPTSLMVSPPQKTEPGCMPLARLERIGPKSAFAEVGAFCTRSTAERFLYVVRLGKTLSIGFEMTAVDPSGAPKLSLDVDGADRDKDGLDDVALRDTVEGGQPPFEPGPKLSAKLAFFDRPAGISRDADEPEASLKAIAAQAVAKAAKAKDASTVPPLVGQMRMLYRAMCEEGGAPRLLKAKGGAVSCGNQRALEDAGVAEVKALAQTDVVRALIAAETVQLAPATKTAAKTKELEALLASAAPPVQTSKVKNLAVAVPLPRGPHPEWGPLSFEPSGKLLVRTTARVARVDPQTGEESDAEVQAWPSQVTSPDGKLRWLESYHACEGVAVRATFSPTADGDVHDVLLPVAPQLGTRCSGRRGEPAPSVPLAWGAHGLEAIVGSVPLLVRPEAEKTTVQTASLEEPAPLGSARSPNGKNIAIRTKSGLLVKTPQRTLRVRSSDLEPYDDLRSCTIDNDGALVACAKKGRVLVVTVPAAGD